MNAAERAAAGKAVRAAAIESRDMTKETTFSVERTPGYGLTIWAEWMFDQSPVDWSKRPLNGTRAKRWKWHYIATKDGGAGKIVETNLAKFVTKVLKTL